MQSTNFAERDLSDAAKASLHKLKYEDAISDLKLAEAKIERLQSKIDYLNRCLTTDESDATKINQGTKMGYENWKDLKPLEGHVALGTKCVCLVDWCAFRKGDVVTVDKHSNTARCINENGKVHVMDTHELALLPEDAHEEPEQTPITTSDLLARAQSTYPPTQIVLRAVCKRIGTASQIAGELRLGEHGARTVRKWISDPRKVPFSVWFALLAIDEVNHEP